MKSLDQIAEESVSKYVADHKFARLPCAREVLVAMARRGAEAVLAALYEHTSESAESVATQSIDEIVDSAITRYKSGHSGIYACKDWQVEDMAKTAIQLWIDQGCRGAKLAPGETKTLSAESINTVLTTAMANHMSDEKYVLSFHDQKVAYDVARRALRIAADSGHLLYDPATPPAKPQSDNFKSTAWATGGVVGGGQSNFTVVVRQGYRGLLAILIEALNQAQAGKGAERHNLGGDTPFEEQRMQSISNLIGSVDGMTYQACKKITEGVKLPTLERKTAELLGAINYCAGMIVWLRAQGGPATKPTVQNVDVTNCESITQTAQFLTKELEKIAERVGVQPGPGNPTA